MTNDKTLRLNKLVEHVNNLEARIIMMSDEMTNMYNVIKDLKGDDYET